MGSPKTYEGKDINNFSSIELGVLNDEEIVNNIISQEGQQNTQNIDNLTYSNCISTATATENNQITSHTTNHNNNSHVHFNRTNHDIIEHNRDDTVNTQNDNTILPISSSISS